MAVFGFECKPEDVDLVGLRQIWLSCRINLFKKWWNSLRKQGWSGRFHMPGGTANSASIWSCAHYRQEQKDLIEKFPHVHDKIAKVLTFMWSKVCCYRPNGSVNMLKTSMSFAYFILVLQSIRLQPISRRSGTRMRPIRKMLFRQYSCLASLKAVICVSILWAVIAIFIRRTLQLYHVQTALCSSVIIEPLAYCQSIRNGIRTIIAAYCREELLILTELLVSEEALSGRSVCEIIACSSPRYRRHSQKFKYVERIGQSVYD